MQFLRSVFLFLVLFPALSYAQRADRAGSALTFGLSGMYGSARYDGVRGPKYRGEYIHGAQFNMAIPIGRHFDIGMNMAVLRQLRDRYEFTRQVLVGPFVQFDFLPEKRWHLCLDAGLYWGDYRERGTVLPYFFEDRLAYGSWALTAEIPLEKRLYLELGIADFVQFYDRDYVRDRSSGLFTIGFNYKLPL